MKKIIVINHVPLQVSMDALNAIQLMTTIVYNVIKISISIMFLLVNLKWYAFLTVTQLSKIKVVNNVNIMIIKKL